MAGRNVVVVFVFLVVHVSVNCVAGSPWRSYFYDYDRPSSQCETELEEIKKKIDDLYSLVTAVVEKFDPDFKWKPPDKKSVCPPGFHFLPRVKSCYKVVYENHKWTSAVEKCRQLNDDAHLVAITSAKENADLKVFLRKELSENAGRNVCHIANWGDQSPMLWTSGHRSNISSCEDPLVWMESDDTTSPITYSDWCTGEPNCASDSESCVHIRPRLDYKWNDVSCDKMLCPLCEYNPPEETNPRVIVP